MKHYSEILPKGKENAIAMKDLARVLGFANTRALRDDISKARENGAVICSTTKSGKSGYFLPANREEIKEYLNTMERRAKSAFIAMRAAKKALEQIEGQGALFDKGEKDDPATIDFDDIE